MKEIQVQPNQVYVSEPLTGQSDIEAIKTFCRRIASVCERCGFFPYLPFDVTDPIKNAEITPQEVARADIAQTVGSELCIFVLPSSPPESVGVGIEMGLADNRAIPSIVVKQKGKNWGPKVEGMIQSNVEKGIWGVIEMLNFDDSAALDKLRLEIQKMFNSGKLEIK